MLWSKIIPTRGIRSYIFPHTTLVLVKGLQGWVGDIQTVTLLESEGPLVAMGISLSVFFSRSLVRICCLRSPTFTVTLPRALESQSTSLCQTLSI